MNKLRVLVGMVVLCTAVAVAQTGAAASLPKGEVSFNYVNTRGDFAPNGSSAFHLQGVSFGGVLNLTHGFGVAGEMSGGRAGKIDPSGQSLSLLTFLVGLRYSLPVRHVFTPYAQVLFGGVHGFRGEFPKAGALSTTASAFAMALGGGVEIRLHHHFSLNALQIDYFRTNLPNDYSNRQNNMRIITGIVYRFGK